ncbi:MAG: hypothetical protein GX941_06335 [Candidatus Methanofastidiosa archaeon]|nr:hypothetical protein [Candidatus Methanofastidiosa archaeon]HOM96245.1 hypothetical protein [Methanofastidiosum sp.]HPC81195.1 hypothetical protein [Methanofastidiosum sp.]HRS25664.1 hypothetical protein [Methanofastidiosum sp.]
MKEYHIAGLGDNLTNYLIGNEIVFDVYDFLPLDNGCDVMRDKDIKVIRKEIEKMKKSLEEVEKRLDHLTKVKTADEIFSGPVSEAP